MSAHLEWLRRKLDERREQLDESYFFAELVSLTRKLVGGQGHIYGAIFPSEAIVAARAELLPTLKQWLDDMRARGVTLPSRAAPNATRAWLDLHAGVSGWFHVPALRAEVDDKLWSADFDLAMRLDVDIARQRVRYRGERVAESEFEANVVRAGSLLREVVGGDVEPYLDVERSYLLDFMHFNAALHEKLRAVQEQLPGYLQKDRFYGADAGEPPNLRCSIEPSGLHVTGCLLESQWNAWHLALAAQLEQFPLRLLSSYE